MCDTEQIPRKENRSAIHAVRCRLRARARQSLMADDDESPTASTSALRSAWVDDPPFPPCQVLHETFRQQKWSWMPSRSCRPRGQPVRVCAASSDAPAQGDARRAPLHAQALRRRESAAAFQARRYAHVHRGGVSGRGGQRRALPERDEVVQAARGDETGRRELWRRPELREEALRRARACACMQRSSIGSRKSFPRQRRSRRARCARTAMRQWRRRQRRKLPVHSTSS